MRRFLLISVAPLVTISAGAQTPMIFGVSNVTIGTQKIPTFYFHAVGKWSDRGVPEIEVRERGQLTK